MRLSWLVLAYTVALASVSVVACGGSAGSTRGGASDPTKSGVVPVSAADNGKGVSLTGDYAYDEEHDPSGWGGKTELPGAVGGGPAATPPAVAPATPQGAPAQQAEPTAPAAAPPPAATPPVKADAKKPATKTPAPAPKDPKTPAPPPAPPSKDLVPDSKELLP